MEKSVKKMKDFYKNKKVLITGHTGFKGSWMSFLLSEYGANVTGISLEPIIQPSIYRILNLQENMDSRIFDIRDLDSIKEVFEEIQPEIVIHLAAQPLVRESYENPVYTYDVNVMGTVNICECIRKQKSVKSFVNVTTDKVYENKEWSFPYREIDNLNGYDPYSNSKSCSELVTDSYINSFFNNMDLAVSRCRAGNVIGGGDFNENRIIPDCVKACINHEVIKVRNPNSVRPYQHVLEPVMFYLYLAMLQYKNKKFANTYNIGPDDCNCVTTGEIVDTFCKCWKNNSNWKSIEYNGPHEAHFLKLDCSKTKSITGWKPAWNIEQAVSKTVDWYKAFYNNNDVISLTRTQIMQYEKEILW